jgi:hypothetical protein
VYDRITQCLSRTVRTDPARGRVTQSENAIVGRPERIEGLSDEERALLADALRVLRRQRGQAWNAACDVAEAQGKRRPALRHYGIEEIRRLARRFGIRSTHPMED